jgi:hypothetical protein
MFQPGSANSTFIIEPKTVSTLLDQRGSALADFLKRRFEATKLFRA